VDEIVDTTRQEELIRRSVKAILRNQSPNGAIVASPDFSQYHFCWLRDGSFSAYALDVAGEHEAAAQYHDWVRSAVHRIRGVIDEAIARRHAGHDVGVLEMPPARFTLEGTVVVDGWPNFQIDGYGTWLWSLGRHLASAPSAEFTKELRDAVARVGRYLEAFALNPCYDVWEESGSAIHTSTLASVYGGLVSASELLDDTRYLETAATVKATIEKIGSRLGYFNKSSENDDVDASVLWLDNPFHVVASNDLRFADSVAMISDRLSLDGGVRRYPTDTYFGSGAWPVLTASLGWHYLSAGNTGEARRCLDWIAERFDDDGHLGEQFGGHSRDPHHYNEWVDRWGPPAADLTWSHAMYVILADAIVRGTAGPESELDAAGTISGANSPEVAP
jgi:GH15 family glucan-1,4-alpha-glucosidase